MSDNPPLALDLVANSINFSIGSSVYSIFYSVSVSFSSISLYASLFGHTSSNGPQLHAVIMHCLKIINCWCFGNVTKCKLFISLLRFSLICPARDNGSGVNFWPRKLMKPDPSMCVPLHLSWLISRPYSAKMRVASINACVLFPLSTIRTQSSANMTTSYPIARNFSIIGLMLPTKRSVESEFPCKVPVSIFGSKRLRCVKNSLDKVPVCLRNSVGY